jgi:MipA family protein
MRFLVLPFLLAAATASAQDGNYVSFDLGLGAASGPAYFGSDTSETGVTGIFANPSMSVGSLSFGQGSDSYGLGLTGSFRVIGERSAADYPELAGLPDVDLAIEAGGGLSYSTQSAEVFAVGRYGVIGHESFVGEIGGDYILQPTDSTELRVGPRLFFGDDDYAATYFGTGAFDAKGGILSRGLQASAEYSFNDDWGVIGTIKYDQLLNDAASSPITQTTDQVGVSLIVTRKVTWSF